MPCQTVCHVFLKLGNVSASIAIMMAQMTHWQVIANVSDVVSFPRHQRHKMLQHIEAHVLESTFARCGLVQAETNCIRRGKHGIAIELFLKLLNSNIWMSCLGHLTGLDRRRPLSYAYGCPVDSVPTAPISKLLLHREIHPRVLDVGRGG